MKYEFSPWEVARINDLGDVPLPEANNNEACIRDISNFYKKLSDSQVKPVSIGRRPLHNRWHTKRNIWKRFKTH